MYVYAKTNTNTHANTKTKTKTSTQADTHANANTNTNRKRRKRGEILAERAMSAESTSEHKVYEGEGGGEGGWGRRCSTAITSLACCVPSGT